MRTVSLLAQHRTGSTTTCPNISWASPSRDDIVARSSAGSPSASKATSARSPSTLRQEATRPSSTTGPGSPWTKLPDLIVPFKRGVYEQVVAAFRHLKG